MVDRLEVSIEIIVHATEDLDRILDSFVEFFNFNGIEFSKQDLTGHFENPISLLSAKITKDQAKRFVQILSSRISRPEMDELIASLESRIQDSTLHIRIGKQELIKGKLVLEEKDPIKIRIFTPSYKKKDIVKNYVLLLKEFEKNKGTI
jgi:hypothetical protein